MISRQQYRVKNNKKLLHKVGKQWVTVSSITLALLGVSTVVSHASTDQPQNPSVLNATNLQAQATKLHSEILRNLAQQSKTSQKQQTSRKSATEKPQTQTVPEISLGDAPEGNPQSQDTYIPGIYDGLNYKYDTNTGALDFISGTLTDFTHGTVPLSGGDTDFLGGLSYRYPKATSITFEKGIDYSNITDMSHMFSDYGNFFPDLETIDLSNFDTSDVTNMSDMFADNFAQKIIFGNHFDMSHVTNVNNMFGRMPNLAEIDFNNYNLNNNEVDTSTMFSNDSGIKPIVYNKGQKIVYDTLPDVPDDLDENNEKYQYIIYLTNGQSPYNTLKTLRISSDNDLGGQTKDITSDIPSSYYYNPGTNLVVLNDNQTSTVSVWPEVTENINFVYKGATQYSFQLKDIIGNTLPISSYTSYLNAATNNIYVLAPSDNPNIVFNGKDQNFNIELVPNVSIDDVNYVYNGHIIYSDQLVGSTGASFSTPNELSNEQNEGHISSAYSLAAGNPENIVMDGHNKTIQLAQTGSQRSESINFWFQGHLEYSEVATGPKGTTASVQKYFQDGQNVQILIKTGYPGISNIYYIDTKHPTFIESNGNQVVNKGYNNPTSIIYDGNDENFNLIQEAAEPIAIQTITLTHPMPVVKVLPVVPTLVTKQITDDRTTKVIENKNYSDADGQKVVTDYVEFPGDPNAVRVTGPDTRPFTYVLGTKETNITAPAGYHFSNGDSTESISLNGTVHKFPVTANRSDNSLEPNHNSTPLPSPSPLPIPPQTTPQTTPQSDPGSNLQPNQEPNSDKSVNVVHFELANGRGIDLNLLISGQPGKLAKDTIDALSLPHQYQIISGDNVNFGNNGTVINVIVKDNDSAHAKHSIFHNNLHALSQSEYQIKHDDLSHKTISKALFPSEHPVSRLARYDRRVMVHGHLQKLPQTSDHDLNALAISLLSLSASLLGFGFAVDRKRRKD